VMTMAPDGFEKWKASLERLLGRFAVVLIAEADTGPVGFLAAKIRTPSPPFLSNPVGFVSEVFVAESQRGLHIGKRLMESVEQWFRGQDIQRIELQVIMDNTIARNSYRNWGWKEELVQMVRHLPPASEDS
jgi:GNAT superfamily N-acetyltransferase